jgi:hypothetical protein
MPVVPEAIWAVAVTARKAVKQKADKLLAKQLILRREEKVSQLTFGVAVFMIKLLCLSAPDR